MTMREMLYALLPSAFLRLVTPLKERWRDGPRYHIESRSTSTEKPATAVQLSAASAAFLKQLDELKPKFNPSTDLLAISKKHLEEAKKYGTADWLSTVAENMIVFSDDLKNAAIVRSGYAAGLF